MKKPINMLIVQFPFSNAVELQKRLSFLWKEEILGSNWLIVLILTICAETILISDRPKFDSVPGTAEIKTWTEILVSVPARLEFSVSAKISVQRWNKFWLKVSKITKFYHTRLLILVFFKSLKWIFKSFFTICIPWLHGFIAILVNIWFRYRFLFLFWFKIN